MKITSKNLNEYNISDYIEERKEKSYLDIFLELEKDVKEKVAGEKYSSLDSNYTPIFLYHIMNDNIEIKEFKKILKQSSNYEYGLHRFFDRSDVNFDEKESLWDKMSYYFYKKENQKMIIDDSKFKYIEEFCKNTRKKNLLDFHSSRISLFISRFLIQNPEYLKNFSNIVENNKNLNIGKHYEYESLDTAVLKIFSDYSYENDLTNFYNLIKNDEFLSQKLKNSLIKLNYNHKLIFELSVVQFISKHDSEFLDIMMEEIKKKKNELDEKNFTELISETHFIVKSMIKNKNIVLDISKIDLKEDFKVNIPLLLFLQEKIDKFETDKIVNISEDFIHYFEINYQKLEEKNKKQFSYEDFLLISNFDFNKIKDYLTSKLLENNLQNNKKGKLRI